MASWIPAALLLFALIVLIRYPLTRTRMEEIKSVLVERRAAAKPAES
jgi:Na+/melibiose symporter-like transporter